MGRLNLVPRLLSYRARRNRAGCAARHPIRKPAFGGSHCTQWPRRVKVSCRISRVGENDVWDLGVVFLCGFESSFGRYLGLSSFFFFFFFVGKGKNANVLGWVGGVQMFFEGQFISICLRCIFPGWTRIHNSIPAVSSFPPSSQTFTYSDLRAKRLRHK